MRFELASHVASSALNALRMLQDVVETHDIQSAPAHGPANPSPNLTGCVDSPEASTILLMLVGTIGIYYGSSLFLKLARRRALATRA